MERRSKGRRSVNKCWLFLEPLEDRQVLSSSFLGSLPILQGPLPSVQINSSALQQEDTSTLREILFPKQEAKIVQVPAFSPSQNIIGQGCGEKPPGDNGSPRVPLLPGDLVGPGNATSNLPQPNNWTENGAGLVWPDDWAVSADESSNWTENGAGQVLSDDWPVSADEGGGPSIAPNGENVQVKERPPVFAPNSVLPFSPPERSSTPGWNPARAGENVPAVPTPEANLPCPSLPPGQAAVFSAWGAPATDSAGHLGAFLASRFTVSSAHFLTIAGSDETSRPRDEGALQGAGLWSGATIVDTAALDAAFQHLGEDLDQAGRSFPQVLTGAGVFPWMWGTLVTGLALEVTRRRTRKQAVGLGLAGLDGDSTFTWMPGLPGSFSAEEE